MNGNHLKFLVVQVFVAVRGLSLLAVSRGYTSCSAWVSHGDGFFCCRAQTLSAQALVVAAPGL